MKKKCLIKNVEKNVYSSLKDGRTGDDGVKLNGHISDYLACYKIWNEFKMKNMGDYDEEKDVLLLADVLEKFIDTCLKFYKLDPCHCFSSLD